MLSSNDPVIPRADGLLSGGQVRSIPLGGPRLEATLDGFGRSLRIGVWGCGHVGTASLSAGDGSWRIRPNLIEAGTTTVALARSVPAIVVKGAEATIRPARRPLPRVDLTADRAEPERHTSGATLHRLPWGCLAWRRDGDGIVIGGGVDADEALGALEPSADAILDEARAYAAACARLEIDDPVLGSMFAHSLHAGLAAVKRDGAGAFAGLAAGPGYSLPPRTYYRDAYWTVPALLPVEPERVSDTLELLAAGIHDDGEAPSAVITATSLPPRVRNAIQTHKGAGVAGGAFEHDWWRDHFDSPLFFVLMLADYVAFTGDERLVDGTWEKLRAILRRYRDLCPPGSSLPRKPYNERDWADNVFRSGLVTYDLALYHGALTAMASFARGRDARLAETWSAEAARVRVEANERLWLERQGHYLDYAADDPADDRVEDHLAIDTLTAVRFGLADEARADRLLDRVGDTLESRHNAEQPFGDFGVLCCFPPYARRRDLKAKSAFGYRYHNGADWPYWDGVYAGLLLDRGRPSWRYALLRWWEYGLERGWVAPVEYYSPPFAPGATLQAWSAMPAAAVMQSGFGVRPPWRPTPPPWGASFLRDVVVEGERRDVISDGTKAWTAEPAGTSRPAAAVAAPPADAG